MEARPWILGVITLIGLAGDARCDVEGVRTDVAGFVGTARKGPLDAPTKLESWEGFVDASLPDPYLAPSIAAFFTNGGRRCYVVRVASDADIEAGRIVLLVGFAPVRPAEFQILTIVQQSLAPEPRLLRGDANGDGAVDLSDPIGVLGYIFLGGAEPACLDAADSADEGHLTISSAIYTLNFLFLGSRPPPPPYPDYGSDPTADTLGVCSDSTPPCR